jgi:beta-lactam-binding protein with PASTA domain
MNIDKYFQGDSVKDLFKHIGITLGLFAFLCIVYFYIYLPNYTHHGDVVEVPNLKGVSGGELDHILEQQKLRFEVYDSSYSDSLPPLSVVRQFPEAGAKVKENRIIFVSLNRVAPPTLLMPDLTDGSLVNAKTVLKSNGLKLGKTWYEPSPFKNLVKDFRYNGKTIAPGTRIPKGAVIDLIVGDGRGQADFMVGNLVGDSYETALQKLIGWNLHLGRVEIAKGADTTGTVPYVFKQEPEVGDSVRSGDPVHLWIAPKGYKPDEEE